MLAHTYAQARNIDPNEAYTRLDVALKNLRLIEGVQQAIWNALREKKQDLEPNAVVDLVAKKLEKPRRFKAFKPKRADEGGLAALTILIDVGASVSSGEAWDLLETAEGEKLLRAGFKGIGEHLATEMLR
jgi:hypothetical protein